MLAVDQPGFGGSDKGPVEGHFFTFAADKLAAFLDELGIERVHLLGNSLGGGTATRFALDHPERLGRLVLMGPGGLQQNLFSPDPTEGIKRLYEFGGEPTRERMRAFVSTMVHDQRLVTDELVDERLAAATAPGAREAMQAMGASFMDPERLRGGLPVARRLQDPRPHAADLGSRGPGQPGRRRVPRAQADPQGFAARLPALRSLGADRGRGGLPRRDPRLPGPAPRTPVPLRSPMSTHDRHRPSTSDRWATSASTAPTSTSGATSAARCSASPRGAAPTRRTSTSGWTSSPPASWSRRPTRTGWRRWAGRSPTTTRSPRPSTTSSTTASRSSRPPPTSWPSAGSRAWSASPTPSRTSSSSTTGRRTRCVPW